MSASPEISIVPLTPDRLDDFLTFFDGPAFADNPGWADCYCWFPYSDEAGVTDEGGDAFLRRSARQNRESISEAILAGRAGGYLAYAQDRVVGFINAAPRSRYPQLAELPGDSDTIGATPCFTVDPGWRRQGIARRLLSAAIEGLRQDGMRRMEAGPYTAPQDDAHRYHGTIELYESAGYQRVADLPGGQTLMEKEL